MKINNSHTSSLYKIAFALYLFIFIVSDGAKIAFLMAQNSCLTISFIMFSPTLGVDLVSAIQVIILYYLYAHISELQATCNKLHITRIRRTYTDIAECWDKIKPVYFNLVSKTHFTVL